MLQHIHLDQCNSTQTVLKEILSNESNPNPNILVSTNKQLEGLGRRGNNWVHFDNALALSFTLKPSDQVTLTPLEIGVILVDYLQEKYQTELKLKWPNDILNQNGEKCGGILIHTHHNQLLVVGVGINLGKFPKESDITFDKYNAGLITDEEIHNKKEICHEVYQFLLNNRIQTNQVIESWLSKCAHLNRKVSIEDKNGTLQTGLFSGIGDSGEALILSEQKIHSHFSGSLRLLD
jgi:biotin-[acetyl-CoA-carboxylase] ligase BirA-like protein